METVTSSFNTSAAQSSIKDLILNRISFNVRFMNNRVPSSKRYQPTEYEHAANCATHGVREIFLIAFKFT
ncbi:Monocyte to macrophage differentiation factor 2 [Triplophysa tibetana]|uniref:Monocyte to macrophage differentiation factor 2 n=1 Tax=Triplophysa tibetana TaxID=1572043 RepID=A0A5A9N8B4_9TELE|nr:Monocyte to macrophage differentiation factor 2 [Triplophysa tibetana]